MPPPLRNNTAGVYVSNIPYDMSEEQLKDVMARVGPVARATLTEHKDTGRKKGFGFVDYYSETAASAVRNLNGVLVSGRPLSIAFQQDTESTARLGDPDSLQSMIREPPRGREPDRGMNSTDAISQTLAAIPPGELDDILARMKGRILDSPEEARQLLTQQPQLAYALFQAMLMLNLVDPAVIQRMMAGSAAPAPPPPTLATNASPYPPPPSSGYPPPGAAAYPPPSSVGGYPPGGPPPPTLHQHPAYGAAAGAYPPAAGPPPSAGGYYGAPPPQVAAPPPPQQMHTVLPPQYAGVAPEQKQQLLRIMNMTEGEIGVLPADQRNQVLKLRSQLGV